MRCKNCKREIRPATKEDYWVYADKPNPKYRHVGTPNVSCYVPCSFDPVVEWDEAELIKSILLKYEA